MQPLKCATSNNAKAIGTKPSTRERTHMQRYTHTRCGIGTSVCRHRTCLVRWYHPNMQGTQATCVEGFGVHWTCYLN
eukprot:1520216-Amphidinium_carterae.1